MQEKILSRQILKPFALVLLVLVTGLLGAYGPTNAHYALYHLKSLGTSFIFICIFVCWIFRNRTRIMQPQVRKFLFLVGVGIIFWISVRTIKYECLRTLAIPDRFAWYLYYLPMIFLPLLLFYLSFTIGKGDHYQFNPKWYLLNIPAAILFLFVLTNDVHGLVFMIDKTKHAYGQAYTHGIVYYLIAAFILTLLLLATMILTKNCRKYSTRIPKLPICVILIGLLYNVLYINNEWFGSYFFLDITLFGCLIIILLLESFIYCGLIHSNKNHKIFFEQSNLGTQIIDLDGQIKYSSDNTAKLPTDDFLRLQLDKSIEIDENTLRHMIAIRGGYVSYTSDISAIRQKIKELENSNASLYQEIEILSRENKQRETTALIEKQTQVQDILLNEFKYKNLEMRRNVNRIQTQHNMDALFDLLLDSVHIKRKVNLILSSQTCEAISVKDLVFCFDESFRILKLHHKACAINLVKLFEMPSKTAILCYDLFHQMIKQSYQNLSAVFLTFNMTEETILFILQTDCKKESLFLSEIEHNKLRDLNGNIRISEENDDLHIEFIFMK